MSQALYRSNERAIWDLPEHRYVPQAAREIQELPPPQPNSTAADIERGTEQWQRLRASYAALVSAGAKLVAGTDVPVFPLVPGFSLQRELGLLVEIGLTPLQAIQAASRNAADAAGKLDQVGTVEEGKAADLVLLDADPLADIRNTTRIATVIARGRLLDRGTLDRMLADAEVYARGR